MQLWEFANVIELKLSKIQQSDFSSLGLFELIENMRFIEDMRALAVSLKGSKTDLTFDAKNPFLLLIAKHMGVCVGTEAAIINYVTQSSGYLHKSPANDICVYIGDQLEELARLEKGEKKDKTPKMPDFIMPPLKQVDLKEIPLHLKENMLLDFKRDKERVVRILDSINFNMSTFAKQLLSELEQLPKDSAKLYPIIYFESLFTLEDLTKLLTKFKDSNEPISRANLQELQKFMHVRWQRVNGSCAYYNRCLYSGANIAMQLLKFYLTIANLKDDYLNSDPESYLKHKTPDDINESVAEANLREWVVKRFSDRVELNKYAIQEWNRNLTAVTYNLNGVRDMNREELGQRMNLFCVFQLYIDNRRKTPEGYTLFGGFPAEKKIKAAEAVQKYLMENSLATFNNDLADPKHYLHKHKGPLENAELAKFLELVSFASTSIEQQAIQQANAGSKLARAS